MANTYEYCYSYLEPIIEESSRFRINTSDFTPSDLSLFVESLETISRVEFEKRERRQRRKEQRMAAYYSEYAEVDASRPVSPLTSSPECYPVVQITNLDSSSGQSADEVDDAPMLYMEPTKTSSNANPSIRSQYDENYYSGPGSGKLSPCSSTTSQQSEAPSTSPSTSAEVVSRPVLSDSEESGVFNMAHKSRSTLYENFATIFPSKRLLHRLKQRSKRSRLMGFVLKGKKATSSQQLSTVDVDQEATEFEHKLNNIIKEQLEKLGKPKDTSRRNGIVLNEGSDEGRFLDRALRYLTM